MKYIPAPNSLKDEHLEYLDRLRESGITNMFGSADFLVEAFKIPLYDAEEILSYWMATFSARHSELGKDFDEKGGQDAL
tara:strand:- start:988 stop:1224 length:237 start_codon:yes stop_codon:yes gene_type:complete